MKNLIRLVVIGAMLTLLTTASWAVVLRQPERNLKFPQQDLVNWHNGGGEDKIAVAACQEGVYKVFANDGQPLVELLRPCISGSAELDKSKDVSMQFGVSPIKVFDLASFHISLFDTRTGKMDFGSGLSLNFAFDDTFTNFMR